MDDFSRLLRVEYIAVSATAGSAMVKTAELKVPEDLQQCQQMIVQMYEQMQGMQGQLDALLRARYGTKSEVVPVGQLRLFGDETKDLEEEKETPALEAKVQIVRTHG